MGFREDRDAIAHRAEALERELAEARAKLARADLERTLAVDELATQNAALRAEHAAKERTAAPFAQRHAALLTAFAIVSILMGVVLVWRIRSAADRAAAYDEIERTRLERELSTAEAERHAADVASARAAEELRRSTEEHQEELRALRATTTRQTVGPIVVVRGTVTARVGPSLIGVGAACVLTLGVDEDGQCLGRFTSGSDTFEAHDRPVELGCLMADGRRWDPRIDRTPAIASADPVGAPVTLLYDAAARTILVGRDEPPLPPWSVTLRVDDDARVTP